MGAWGGGGVGGAFQGDFRGFEGFRGLVFSVRGPGFGLMRQRMASPKHTEVIPEPAGFNMSFCGV